MPRRTTADPRGQTLAAFTLVLLAVLVAGGVVLDGSVTRERASAATASTDDVARAGLAELEQHASDRVVWQALQNAAEQRDIAIVSAQYTDARGVRLGVAIGSATDGLIPADAAGIHVLGTARISGLLPFIGLAGVEVHTRTTAVAGRP
jgi:hypothetical protein